MSHKFTRKQVAKKLRLDQYLLVIPGSWPPCLGLAHRRQTGQFPPQSGRDGVSLSTAVAALVGSGSQLAEGMLLL